MSATARPLLRGFGLLLLVNAAFLVVGWALVACFPRTEPGPWYSPIAPPVYLFGATQLLWALPWQVWAFVKGRKRFGFGLVLAALATAFANGALFLVAMGSMDLPH